MKIVSYSFMSLALFLSATHIAFCSSTPADNEQAKWNHLHYRLIKQPQEIVSKNLSDQKSKILLQAVASGFLWTVGALTFFPSVKNVSSPVSSIGFGALVLLIGSYHAKVQAAELFGQEQKKALNHILDTIQDDDQLPQEVMFRLKRLKILRSQRPDFYETVSCTEELAFLKAQCAEHVKNSNRGFWGALFS